MEIPTLLERALEHVHDNQAELARQLGRSEPTISRWRSGRNTPDFESCLRLARIVGVPARQVLEAAKLDASLLPTTEDAVLSPFEIDIRQRAARMKALVNTTDGVPEDFVDTYVTKILDRTEDEITDQLKIVKGLRARQSRPNTSARKATVTEEHLTGNKGKTRTLPRKPTLLWGHDLLAGHRAWQEQ